MQKGTDEIPTDDLPDDALIVRGGTMVAKRVLRKARLAKPHLNGVAGISVAAASTREMTLRELIGAGEIPHHRVQRSTCGRIRAAGFRPFRTGKWPHCTIDLGPDPTNDAADRLIAAFDAPEANPGKEMK
jgi:hypothetical protein